jgi:tRNA pseudouridine55 synthase
MDGIIVVDKPGGMTSHDVVACVRRWSGIRRVGHAGTLDPLATGVLVLCLGQATRLSEYLMASPKQYRATILLGVETDTYDREGKVVRRSPVNVSRAQVEAALAEFVGRIAQVPPIYSALKRAGTPLYRLARQGREVERQARPVEIYALQLVDWSPPQLTIEVTCSPGTYIRSLAHDLGQRLGCGAHLTALTRLASGEFRLDQAVTLDELSAAFAEGTWQRYLLPMDTALQGLPALHLDARQAARIRRGMALPAAPDPPGPQARAYDPDGHLLAILKRSGDGSRWQPEKVFHTSLKNIPLSQAKGLTDGPTRL